VSAGGDYLAEVSRGRVLSLVPQSQWGGATLTPMAEERLRVQYQEWCQKRGRGRLPGPLRGRGLLPHRRQARPGPRPGAGLRVGRDAGGTRCGRWTRGCWWGWWCGAPWCTWASFWCPSR
jgi:hypothetical protein